MNVTTKLFFALEALRGDLLRNFFLENQSWPFLVRINGGAEEPIPFSITVHHGTSMRFNFLAGGIQPV